SVRLGVVVDALHDDGRGVDVVFSDGSEGRFDAVIGADGLYSSIRQMIFPDAPRPQFTGQGVWRHNFERPAELVSMHVYDGPIGMGLVPLAQRLMYMYVTTPEPGNPRYPREGLAAAMRNKLEHAPPRIAELAERIRAGDQVVYHHMGWTSITGDWRQ